MSVPAALRVVTYNIHGGRPLAGRLRLVDTARVLAALAPDLAGLQEVNRYLPPPGAFEDQPRRLRELLGLEVSFQPGIRVGPCAYGNALLSRVRPLWTRRVRLPSGWEPRALLEAELQIEGRTVRVFNTHLGLGTGERARAGRVLAERIRACAGPALLLGDLNALPESPEVRALAEGTGLRHCLPGGVFTFPCQAPRLRLDYIMASSHFRVRECRAVPSAASDHLPVAADLLLE